MTFTDKLAALADICSLNETKLRCDPFLDVRQRRRFLGVLPFNHVFAQICVRMVSDEWRVMLIPDKPGEPFVGADYSTTRGDDADAALLCVWVRDSDELRRCTSTEISTIGRRISHAVETAYSQYIENAE